MTETPAQTCPNAATCPSIHYCDPTQYSDHTRGPGYVIVGAIEHTMHAEAHGGNVGPGETVAWVPAEVIDGLVEQRVADLKARLGELIESRETFAMESRRRLLRIEALEAELAKNGDWEAEDQQYEVLLGHPLWGNPVVYDECDTLGGVEAIACRARREMDADELEPGPVYTRRIARDFREETNR